ncbi:aromatic ring-hydroxylating dioxygenase subunit alpha [Sulfolobus sp. S-194]|uniref:aromatic ring-hydroxylating oxygenase subunit alpha n=1 Tax=Sulfolobus sp. S-194 TaxID=2512240 RepID=UPI0014372CCF|nr:aromatic ring-hydroxylating dioxygenase subunit alpha [Sulfolobus sp. S-194]QIW23964.1 aromatic ring-hydroxylating dioxygenase subunit alpha [Sulfolobus sp. S-194]
MYNEWLPVAFSDEVKDIYETNVLGHDIVIIRKNGKLYGLSNRCPHRLAKLSKGKIIEDEIQCPYHGWRFNLEGKLTIVPSLSKKINVNLRKYYVKEKYGIIWISVDEPKDDLPEIKEWESFRKIKCGPYYINANPFRVLENLFDVSHFPYVHENYLGNPEYPYIPEYNVEITDEEIVAKNIQVYQPNPDGSHIGRYETYTYIVYRPLFLYFTKNDENKRTFSMIFTIKPESKNKSVIFAWIFVNYGYETNEDVIRNFEDTIIMQDKEVLETQPDIYYLDLSREIHVKADKLSIFYRHYLKKRIGKFPALGLL